MKYYAIKVFGEFETGETDRLGNALTREVLLDKDSKARKAIWSDQEVALDPRVITQHLLKIVTTCKRATLEQATYIEIDGEKYQIDSNASEVNSRWRIKGDDSIRWRIVSLAHYAGK